MELSELLGAMIERGAGDLHLQAASPPVISLSERA